MYLNIPVGLWNRMKLDLIPLWVWIWKPDLIFLSSPDLVYKGTQIILTWAFESQSLRLFNSFSNYSFYVLSAYPAAFCSGSKLFWCCRLVWESNESDKQCTFSTIKKNCIYSYSQKHLQNPVLKGTKEQFIVFGLEKPSFHQDQTPERKTSTDCILRIVKDLCSLCGRQLLMVYWWWWCTNESEASRPLLGQ